MRNKIAIHNPPFKVAACPIAVYAQVNQNVTILPIKYKWMYVYLLIAYGSIAIIAGEGYWRQKSVKAIWNWALPR